MSTGQGFTGNNMFAYCGNNPARYLDNNGMRAKNATKKDEENFKVVGAGVQINGSAGGTLASLGVGFEIVVYWGIPECKNNGGIIVAVYTYNEGDISFDTGSLPTKVQEIVDLIINNADLLKVDGANALQALLSGSKLDVSISASVFAVTANSKFKTIIDYTKEFQNETIEIGSIKAGRAWSDRCKTYSIGYSYSVGKSFFRLSLPKISRGRSYYRLIWSSRK